MPNGNAFGNIYEITTPYIDRLSNRLYNEERERGALREKENRYLDDEFSKNLSGIRDADIGELTKAYGDFKLAHKSLAKNRNATPEDQLELLRKKANIYDVLNKSKQDKAWEDAQAKQIMQDKKGYYADNAAMMLAERRKTPYSKIDRARDEDLLYKYTVPDLAKELQTARGSKRKVEILLGASETDPLKDDKEIYEVSNTPNQFYNNLLSGIVSGNKGRNFTGVVMNKYTEPELETLQNQYYAKINDPKFIAVYGKPESFPESSLKTELGKAVAIQTMEEVVNNPLPSAKKVSEINSQRQADDRQKRQQENMKMSSGLIAGRRRSGGGRSGGGGSSDLVDYDVLIDYDKKVIPYNIKTGGKDGWNSAREEIQVVPFTDVDKKDQALIDVKPYNDNGFKYYKKRPDGDWEGDGGQVVSWTKVAQANLDKTAANEVSRGRTTLKANTPRGGGSNPPKNETTAEKMRRLANQK